MSNENLKRNDAKKLMRNERNEAKNLFFSFAKQSKKETKRFQFRFVSLRSEKHKKAKMGHPIRDYETGFEASVLLMVDIFNIVWFGYRLWSYILA